MPNTFQIRLGETVSKMAEAVKALQEADVEIVEVFFDGSYWQAVVYN